MAGWYILRDYHRSRGEFEIGNQMLSRMRAAYPLKEITDEGFRLIETGRLANARPLVDSALAIDSLNHSVNLLAALYCQRSGDLERAGHYFERVRQLDPGKPLYFLYAFDYYMDLGQPDRAFDLGERGLKLYPGDRELNHKLGMAYLGFRHYDRAESQAERILALDNTDPIGYYIQLHISAIRRNQEDVIDNFRRFKQFNKDVSLDSVVTARFGATLER